MDEHRQKVIDRLRDSKRQADHGGSYAAGYRIGRAWAANTAEVQSLAQLDDFLGNWTGDDFTRWCRSAPSPLPVHVRLFDVISTASRKSDGMAQQFWKAFSPQLNEMMDLQFDSESLSYYWGFIRGALDLWTDVKSEVNDSGTRHFRDGN